MSGKQLNPSDPKYRVHGATYELRKELEALVIFAGKYSGCMKESLYHRIKLINDVLNN